MEGERRVKGLNRFWRILFSTLKDTVGVAVSLAEWRERRRRFTRDEDGCRQTPTRCRGRGCPLSLSLACSLLSVGGGGGRCPSFLPSFLPSVRASVHILMADAFFGLHSKEVGSWKGRRPPRRRRLLLLGRRRRRNFLFAFFCPIGCRRRCHRWPPKPALAGLWPGWLAGPPPR